MSAEEREKLLEIAQELLLTENGWEITAAGYWDGGEQKHEDPKFSSEGAAMAAATRNVCRSYRTVTDHLLEFLGYTTEESDIEIASGMGCTQRRLRRK